MILFFVVLMLLAVFIAFGELKPQQLGRFRTRDSNPAFTQFITSVLPSQAKNEGQLSNAAIFESTADALTAHTGGGQTNGWPITARFSRFTTVAAGNDSATLPPALAGMSLTIRNDASVNAMNVFPASATQGGISGGDTINAGAANAAFSITAAKEATFRCLTTGHWYCALSN